LKILVVDPTQSSPVTVHAATTSDSTGIDVLANPDGSAPGLFTGQVTLGAPGSAPTASSVPASHGDTVTVTYTDGAAVVHSTSASMTTAGSTTRSERPS